MDNFYCPPEKISAGSVLIDGEEFSHLIHVMRKKIGDEIGVVDGEGTLHEVTLEEVREKQARGKITATSRNHLEPTTRLTLAVGILKNPSRFDFLVEKVTELGVKEIIPLETDRTIPSHAKTDRWQKLALAAMKQCGRAYLPRVRELTPLARVRDDFDKFDRTLVAHEQVESTVSLRTVAGDGRSSILVLVGPEGGFSEEEIQMCVSMGCTAFSLGQRRLRTETAAITVAAQILG
jgi:16S rRNA (uracil1498-N3)-methyltransferase